MIDHGTRITIGELKVNLYPGVRIGQRCILHAGVVVGADGFGFASNAGTWVKVPQVGSVQVGDDVEIGANTTIDRGAIDERDERIGWFGGPTSLMAELPCDS